MNQPLVFRLLPLCAIHHSESIVLSSLKPEKNKVCFNPPAEVWDVRGTHVPGPLCSKLAANTEDKSLILVVEDGTFTFKVILSHDLANALSGFYNQSALKSITSKMRPFVFPRPLRRVCG